MIAFRALRFHAGDDAPLQHFAGRGLRRSPLATIMRGSRAQCARVADWQDAAFTHFGV